jgi:Concanavalin A-like lectin/glucanases superfamily/Bacterial Ig-like domain/Bacterial Ig domain
MRSYQNLRLPPSVRTTRLRLALVLALVAFPVMLTAAGPGLAAPTGLVASYSFDEGSGTSALDSSGNGKTATVVGATWGAGRFGSGLTFDGVNDRVDLPGLGTFYDSGFTLEAWVNKQGAKTDVATVGTWVGGTQNGGPMLWVHNAVGRHYLTLYKAGAGYLDSGSSPAVGQWQHLAATYDGATARFYVNGGETANRAHVGNVGDSNTWRIGAYGPGPGGFFDGIIDEVRVYNRAISAAEVQEDMNTGVGPADVVPPTAPTNFAAGTATGTTVPTTWTAATDDRGIAGYNLYRGTTKVGTTTSTNFTFTGLVCESTYTLGVEAFDGGNNVSGRTTTTASTASCGAPTPPGGLVAAYGFDEGAGTVTGDRSGNGKAGTVVGATWAVGRFGEALSFDGVDDWVDLPGLGMFYDSAFTLEAWVKKQGTKTDVAVVGSWVGREQNGGPMLWVHNSLNRHHLTLNKLSGSYLDSARSPAVGQWQYVAATYDGATARFYVDGVETASRAYVGNVGDSNTWRIGAYGPGPMGFFDGVIDEVRIYSRALGAAEIQTDMNSPVPRDTTPPSTPTGLSANATVGSVSLNWNAATDNFGFVRYNVHRGTTSGFTPTSANLVAQPNGTSYVDADLGAGTYYYRVIAEDSSGNVSGPSNQATGVVPADTTPPNVAISVPAAGATVWGTVTVSAAATDNHRVVGVQFRLDGSPLGTEVTTAPFSIPWDTRTSSDGPHILTAVARDPSGNSRTSAPITVTVDGTFAPPDLVAAYGFEEPSGALVADGSGNGNAGTSIGATRTTAGRFGAGLTFDGVDDRVDLPGLGTFYKSGFTYEAWVRKQSALVGDVAVVGSWVGGVLNGGPMLWVNGGRLWALTLATGGANYLTTNRTPAAGQWQHVAATFDGATARFYIDGVQVASRPFAANAGDSNTWRIGAYGPGPQGFFDGAIDEVRIYRRALSQTEIEGDMSSPVPRDSTPPTIATPQPAQGATNVSVGAAVSATFSESMDPATISTATFKLADGAGNAVPASVSYNAATRTASLVPASALSFGTLYRATVEGGTADPRAKDVAGNALAADTTWSFTTQASAAPVLLLTSSARPFSSYVGEILQAEGLNSFTALDISRLSPSLLTSFSVVVLGEVPLTSADVSTLSAWVNNGGRLIALRPDKQLAGLLGLTDAGSTLSNTYLRINTATAPGAGLVGETIQFHGAADRYTLTGATSVATLYSNASTATSNPAVTTRNVGSNGGQAAAFTYDLARSVVLTRQGNPAWAGQDRDQIPGAADIMSTDLFFGAAQGDVQPDWVNLDKVAIPQADEQQRLLANLIVLMSRDRVPTPRFWYLPRGEKAAVVMTGDDHGRGQTVPRFEIYKDQSPAGCSVALWQCVRATTYMYPDTPITNAQAAGYVAEGFEVSIHPNDGFGCSNPSPATLEAQYAVQMDQFGAKYTSVPDPETARFHCISWPDWVSHARVQLQNGIRFDTNYYYFPPEWIGNRPGWWTGSGFPMRFADVDGSTIDVYQAASQMVDETTGDRDEDILGAQWIEAILDRAVGPQGYYGVVTANMHTDFSPHEGSDAIVASALAHDVPVVTAKQMLDWVDGRNASSFRNVAWNGNTLGFTIDVGAGATGLQAMLPRQAGGKTLTALSRGGNAVTFTNQTIKGIEYAVFTAPAGSYAATYAP